MTAVDSISVIGTLLSAVGVGLAIWTLVTAKTIQADLQRRHRLPEILALLQRDMRLFNGLLDRGADVGSSEVQQVLGNFSANLGSAYAKQKIKAVQMAKASCDKLLKDGAQSGETLEISLGFLAAAIASVENHINDDRWRVMP